MVYLPGQALCINSILYAQGISSYKRNRRNFENCTNKVHGRHSSFLQNKRYILYLTEIIFLSLYVNHSSVTFLGVNFFLIEDPGKRILCVHRAESKNLCTVVISGFEPLKPMNGSITYHTTKYIIKR